MQRLICRQYPIDHGGRVVFDEERTHYCVECNTILVPEDKT